MIRETGGSFEKSSLLLKQRQFITVIIIPSKVSWKLLYIIAWFIWIFQNVPNITSEYRDEWVNLSDADKVEYIGIFTLRFVIIHIVLLSKSILFKNQYHEYACQSIEWRRLNYNLSYGIKSSYHIYYQQSLIREECGWHLYFRLDILVDLYNQIWLLSQLSLMRSFWY